MRHRTKGRILGRNPNHQRALLRNLVISLVMTERAHVMSERQLELDENKPKYPGRIITTLEKAKEVRPLVEKCVTLARKAQKHLRDAAEFGTSAERGSSQWKQWRQSEQWAKWNQAMGPALALRRRAIKLIGDRTAVRILFEVLGPRFEDRQGGYTRILKLAKPRLGDAGRRAILEFVGKHDRVRAKAEKPVVE
ncbi:MAG TPA: 50S ribosomal protein L17 [Planctomycetaceae bacterium]|nr:50S ribosomal protein L17 [Planctomycetaceae bacterium]